MLDEVEQSTRRGDHDVCAPAQGHHLRIDGHAAEHDARLDALFEPGSECPKRLADLRRQLPRGNEHQRPNLARRFTASIQQLKQWQDEGRGFAGTRLCLPDHIAPTQDDRNGARLDRRRLRIALLGDGVQEGLGQTQGVEGHEARRECNLRV